MTAIKIKTDGKPSLKLNIHDFSERDIPFLDTLGIAKTEEDSPNTRFIHIHTQEDFLSIRSKILEEYKVLEEKVNKVFLEKR